MWSVYSFGCSACRLCSAASHSHLSPAFHTTSAEKPHKKNEWVNESINKRRIKNIWFKKCQTVSQAMFIYRRTENPGVIDFPEKIEELNVYTLSLGDLLRVPFHRSTGATWEEGRHWIRLEMPASAFRCHERTSNRSSVWRRGNHSLRQQVYIIYTVYVYK